MTTNQDAVSSLLAEGRKILEERAEAERKLAERDEARRLDSWRSLAEAVAGDTGGACVLSETPPDDFTIFSDQWQLVWTPFGGAWCRRTYLCTKIDPYCWRAGGKDKCWRVPTRYGVNPDSDDRDDERTLVRMTVEREVESAAEAVALVSLAEDSYRSAVEEAKARFAK